MMSIDVGIGVSALEFARRVIDERLKQLPPEDRADFAELWAFLGSGEASEEDYEATIGAMKEILFQRPSGMRALPLDAPASEKLASYRERVSSKIRGFRKDAGLTQDELAERSGLLQGYISRLEKGQHSPSHKTLARIADALGIPLTDIDPSCNRE